MFVIGIVNAINISRSTIRKFVHFWCIFGVEAPEGSKVGHRTEQQKAKHSPRTDRSWRPAFNGQSGSCSGLMQSGPHRKGKYLIENNARACVRMLCARGRWEAQRAVLLPILTW